MAIFKKFFILTISLALAVTLSTKTIHGLGEATDTMMPEEYEMEQATPANDWLLMPLRRILSHNGRTSKCTEDNHKCKHRQHDDENNEHQHHKYRCCKKKCMDLSSDSNNCGHCNKRCTYGKKCCRGKCVWLASNRKNCGACNNHCPKHVKCVLGMCKYA